MTSHALILVLGFAQVAGCGLTSHIPDGPHDTTASYFRTDALRIEYPEVAECQTPVRDAAEAALEPFALQDPAELPTLEMTLEEALQMAVQNSPIVRTINGINLSPIGFNRTIYDPALAHADPQAGVEAALAAFDAQYNQSLFWNTTDLPQNVDRGGFTAVFTPGVTVGTSAAWQNELSKTTATGARFALRHIVDYDRNNRPFRLFSSAFQGWIEAEVRQPLGQGAGTTYNRIAGPAQVPGRYNGVLIARVNEDISLADFEASVIDLVGDVEQAYWDLWSAYRVLEATLKGREAALQTYQFQKSRAEAGQVALDAEAQATSQFYQFQSQVQSALGGDTGLYGVEQRLRYLIGLPATDGRLIKPVTEPTDTKVIFDWESSLGQALGRRVEIRRRRFNVKRREMELVAARLNRRPRFDFVGSYRWRGLGDNLIGPTDNGLFDNLYDSITDGDYQEWRAGVELSFPVGLRLASTAVAHAQLNLRRERALLAETELAISHDLTEAARRVELTFQLLETNYDRYRADLVQVRVLADRYRFGQEPINFLLQAQRQVVTSETEFYRSLTDYNLAIRDLHREKGSLLAYNDVQLLEGPWAPGALRDAYERGRFVTPRPFPEKVQTPIPITRASFDPSQPQDTTEGVSQPDRGLTPEVVPADPAGEELPGPQPMMIEEAGAAFLGPIQPTSGVVSEATAPKPKPVDGSAVMSAAGDAAATPVTPETRKSAPLP